MSNRGMPFSSYLGITLPEIVSTDVLNNFGTNRAPLVTDDSASGYAVGSRWINIENGKSTK